jgi:HD-like signal output (HDOD) protein
MEGLMKRRLPLASDRIPVLPQGTLQLLRVLNDDDLDYRTIAAALEHAPSVAARLLALANSAWSAPRSPVSAIDAACSRLGLRVVRTASIALAIAQPFNPTSCPPFRSDVFWGAALLNAEACALLAEQMLPGEVSTARTAGLLSNLGLLWLADVLPDETGAALQAADPCSPGSLNALLSEHCGIGFDESGALLAAAWDLPALLREAIAGQCHPGPDGSPLARLLGAAIRIAGAVRHDVTCPEPAQKPGELGVSGDLQARVIQHLQQRREHICQMAETLFTPD